MPKTVGYARVSTKEQNLERQLIQLRKYVDDEMIVTDKESGKDLNRPGYQSLKVGIGKLQKGDTLVITSIDRLSRNKEDAKKELQYFKENEIRVKILDLPTTLTDMPAGQEWIMEMVTSILIEVLTSFAQKERETIKQRQREGIDAMPVNAIGKKISSKTGRTTGRQTVTPPENWDEVIQMWHNEEITAVEAMKMLDLKKSTFYKLVTANGDQKPEKEEEQKD